MSVPEKVPWIKVRDTVTFYPDGSWSDYEWKANTPFYSELSFHKWGSRLVGGYTYGISVIFAWFMDDKGAYFPVLMEEVQYQILRGGFERGGTMIGWWHIVTQEHSSGYPKTVYAISHCAAPTVEFGANCV